ncbi:MAG: hypothetical protein WCP53_01205, partial [Verrucomicrobiota bacterium]
MHPLPAVAYSAPIFCPEGTPPRHADAMISTLIQTTHTSMASTLKSAKKSTAPAKSAKSKSVKYVYTWG